MIADFSLLVWSLAIAVPIYWALPYDHQLLRFSWLSVVSAWFLWLLSPLIFLTIFLFLALLYSIVLLGRYSSISRPRLKALSWLLFAPMFALELVPADLWAAGFLGQEAERNPLFLGFAFLGLSYTAVRSFLLAREHIDGQGIDPIRALTALLFFGSFVAGPIVGGDPYRTPAARLSLSMLCLAWARIGWGVALFLVINPKVEAFDLTIFAETGSRGLEWLELYRSFLVLYIDFTGYTDIAIGTALLFGIKLPENFRWPLLSTSIQEFWQRWHLSLGAFISTYLFKPLVRKTGKPTRAIFVAFLCVGAWHSLTLPYMVWGAGHGAALAANMTLRKRFPNKDRSRLVLILNRIVGWMITMTLVAILSKFANQSSLTEGFALLGRLF